MDNKFSLNIFNQAGVDSGLARDVSDELQQAVLARLHSILLKEVEIIVSELNSQGHKLVCQYEPVAGDISYIEKDGLRLAIDTVVSCGFSHLVKC